MFKLYRNINNLPLKRLISTSSNILEPLKNRTLLRVSGTQVNDFLQGLITNDIDHLGSGHGSLYSMFLNNRGRVLYDTIIYRIPEKNTYFLECDCSILDNLQKHLKLYRVRRKIDITSLQDEYKLYVLFDNTDIRDDNITSGTSIEKLDGAAILCQKLNESSPHATHKAHRDLLIFRDPRINRLGSRIIAKADANVSEQINEIIEASENTENKKNYRWLRYCLGVGEGVDDLTPGESFPLECNCDYLHGVSFHKGCYVGQELTARVHHTGVVRKRLMPIQFTKVPLKTVDEKIVHENVNLGKFRGIENDAGLALFRISKALTFKDIKFGDGIGVTYIPNWWPSEVPKEIISEVQ